MIGARAHGVVWKRLGAVLGHLKHRQQLFPQSPIILGDSAQLRLDGDQSFISSSY